MTGTDDSLSAARLTDLVKRTLMVMFGRRPVSGTNTLDVPAVWQAIWASMIFTVIVMVYPAITNGLMVLFTRLTVQLLATRAGEENLPATGVSEPPARPLPLLDTQKL